MWEIVLSGCDDETLIEVELTDEQRDLLVDLASRFASASTYGCMPVMRLREKP